MKQLITIALITLTLTGCIDDVSARHDHYCEMVKIWESESHLPKIERNGWPPFKSSVECEA